MTRSRIIISAAVAALIGAMALNPVPGEASTPSSPAERAATAELNRNILAANAAAEARSKAQETQYREQIRQQASRYEEQQRQWEQQQQQYLAQLKSSETNRAP